MLLEAISADASGTFRLQWHYMIIFALFSVVVDIFKPQPLYIFFFPLILCPTVRIMILYGAVFLVYLQALLFFSHLVLSSLLYFFCCRFFVHFHLPDKKDQWLTFFGHLSKLQKYCIGLLLWFVGYFWNVQLYERDEDIYIFYHTPWSEFL